jgi:hypothetical protein
MLDFLEKFSTTQDVVFQTLYLPPNLPAKEVENDLEQLSPPADITKMLMDSAVRSVT